MGGKTSRVDTFTGSKYRPYFDFKGPRSELMDSDPINNKLLTIYYKDLGKRPIYSHETELMLIKKIQLENNQRALDLMFAAKARLVPEVAKKCKGYGIPLMDLIQEGNYGLIKGLKKYDESKGFKVSTFVVWYIWAEMLMFGKNNSKAIRVPVYLQDLLHRINRVSDSFYSQTSYEPTKEDILKLSKNIDVDNIERVSDAIIRVHSLNAPLRNNHNAKGENTLIDILEDESQRPADTVTDTADVDKILSTLTEKEEYVIRKRKGIGGIGKHTLEEVGQQMDLTRERVRQIEEKAMRKLRMRAGGINLQVRLAMLNK